MANPPAPGAPLDRADSRSGNPVYAAGILEARAGELTYIDEFSGHYRPTEFHFFNMLRLFKQKNLIKETTNIQLKINNHSSKKSLTVSDNNLLNTAGFLNPITYSENITPQSTETVEAIETQNYYQLISEKLAEVLGNDCEKHPLFKSFIVVMRQYLKHLPQFKNELEDMQREYSRMQVKEPISHHVANLRGFIKENLLTEMSTDWLDNLKNINVAIRKLNKYIKRIDGYTDGYSHGFWFFAESRAANRKANYLLATKLRDKLVNTTECNFSNQKITQLRDNLFSLNNPAHLTNRGVNSSKLESALVRVVRKI